jgi:hypothetical protein
MLRSFVNFKKTRLSYQNWPWRNTANKTPPFLHNKHYFTLANCGGAGGLSF